MYFYILKPDGSYTIYYSEGDSEEVVMENVQKNRLQRTLGRLYAKREDLS